MASQALDDDLVVPLRSAAARRPEHAGMKAASLAELVAAGFPVPDGVVVTTAATQALIATPPGARARSSIEQGIRDALARLGEGPVAVRSSGVAEDLAGASFAGMYETFLNVAGPDAVVDAVSRCVASARSPRLMSYRGQDGPLPEIAVLIQRMVPADAAGVAFTADPVTGARDTVTLSAVRGLGERLVSGAASAEEWRDQAGTLTRVRDEGVLVGGQAREVVDLARGVAAHAGAPRDIEWAISGGQVVLLQARPITALPDEVKWEAPRGAWIRNFRLGEWIGDPVTPAFETWLLRGVQGRMHAYFREACGFKMPAPEHVVVNGWYFYGGFNAGNPLVLLAQVPRMLFKLAVRFREFAAMTPPMAHLGFDHALGVWREHLLPAYRRVVDDVAARVSVVDARDLPELIDRLADAAGRQFGAVVGVAGYAAKAEGKLALFWKKHLASVEGSFLELVREGEVEAPRPHDVQGLDWVHPVLGELAQLEARGPDQATRARIVEARDALDRRALAALAARPKLLKTYEALRDEARRAHRAREEQSRVVTLAWPTLRRAILRIGDHLVSRGVLQRRDEVFFLQRDEITLALGAEGAAPNLDGVARERRERWQRQRRLAPPLVIGKLPAFYEKAMAAMEDAFHGDAPPQAGDLRGYPGSPGAVTGRARVVRQAEEISRLQDGEILVAPVTTPAWTPAFLRAAAVVTDTGSFASHASIVAREYGLPAVVATGDATTRLHDGDLITVDGNRGIVRLVSGTTPN